MEFRTGIGFDQHLLKKGPPLKLGGLSIPFAKGSVGHSDGDVLLHALVDALLGAAALGDIGTYFPDTDPRWKGANSQHFVKTAAALIKKEGFKIVFVDGIVLAEKPKLSPYFKEIRKKIAKLLTLSIRQVCVKAKTSEGMGVIGQGKAVAAFVAVTLRDISGNVP